jgi:hypothetical protein
VTPIDFAAASAAFDIALYTGDLMPEPVRLCTRYLEDPDGGPSRQCGQVADAPDTGTAPRCWACSLVDVATIRVVERERRRAA